MESKRTSRRQAKVSADDLPVQVRVPDGPPVVYPQAARVLCRIVVRLARMERSPEDAGGTEEEAS
jgi:hypothetical protein